MLDHMEPGTAPSIGDAVTRLAVGCVPANYVTDVLEIMREAELGYLPVLDSFAGRRPLGVVARIDLEDAARTRGRGRLKIADVSIRSVPQLPAHTPVGVFLEAPLPRAVALVVDESGACLGLVERERLVAASENG